MPDYDLESTVAEDRIEQVLAELLREEENGTPFDLARAVQSYPDLETQLREFCRDRAGFDRLAPCLAPTAPRPAAPDLPGELRLGQFGDLVTLAVYAQQLGGTKKIRWDGAG